MLACMVHTWCCVLCQACISLGLAPVLATLLSLEVKRLPGIFIVLYAGCAALQASDYD